jgi:tight adherence protein C
MVCFAAFPSIAVFLGVAGCIFGLTQLFRTDSRIERRVQERKQRVASAQRAPRHDEDSTQSVSHRLGERVAAAWLRQEHRSVRLRQRLQHAGYAGPASVVTFVFLQFTLTLLLGIGAAWATFHSDVSAVDWRLAFCIGGSTGFLIPSGWIHRRKLARQRALNRSLPDFLDLMVSCLDAGQTLEAVIQRIAAEEGFAHGDIADEIRRVQREIELGATADRALLGFADRTNSDEVRGISIVCAQARKYGAQISSTLRAHADRLRDQREQAAEEAAQRAAVTILAPTLLCLFPVIFIVLAAPAAIQIHQNLAGTSETGASHADGTN